MKIPKVLKNLLTNKIVLNIVGILSIFNMIGYLVTGNIMPILFFTVLATLITYFSKNMIIVLGIPLFLVNLFFDNVTKHIEGMEDNTDKDNKDKKTDEQSKPVDDKTNQTNDPLTDTNTNNKQDSKSTQGLPITPLEPTSVTKNSESFEVGRAKKRGGGYDIDYASTIEDAYDQLNNILGSDGIKKLTDDTQKLMKQQMQLAGSMKDMEPMIKNIGPMMEKAKEMMSGMNNNGFEDLVKKMGGINNK